MHKKVSTVSAAIEGLNAFMFNDDDTLGNKLEAPAKGICKPGIGILSPQDADRLASGSELEVDRLSEESFTSGNYKYYILVFVFL